MSIAPTLEAPPLTFDYQRLVNAVFALLTADAFKQSSARSCVRSEKKIEKKTAVT